MALFCPVKHDKMHFLRDSKVGLKEEEHHMRDDDSLRRRAHFCGSQHEVDENTFLDTFQKNK